MMKNIIPLDKFLDSKALFYDKIDYDVIKKSWDILSKYVNLPYVIHIVGTNGKGSTGRFIASFLHQSEQDVLHYTSPHIKKFNERIWINGADVSDDDLQMAHHKLYSLLPFDYLEQLTYFEYTTLLAILLSSNRDYLVLEAGLGGEFDATNVVLNDLTVIPSIGMDHTDFLGDTIEKIATTKLRSCDKCYIFGNGIDQKVLELKKSVLKGKKEILINNNLTNDNIETLPKYMQNNLKLALSVIDYLGFYKEDFLITKLNGRTQKISPNITIDVGHNPLAANVILEEFKEKKVVLVFNSFKDKEYEKVLKILKPIILEVQIIKCNDKRMVNRAILEDFIKKLNLKVGIFDINNIKEDKQYLVFGSFKVVEEFLLLREKLEK